MKPDFNWREKQTWVKRLSAAEIAYTIWDCQEAIAAYPDGENAGYYADEIHVLAMERNHRLKGKA